MQNRIDENTIEKEMSGFFSQKYCETQNNISSDQLKIYFQLLTTNFSQIYYGQYKTQNDKTTNVIIKTCKSEESDSSSLATAGYARFWKKSHTINNKMSPTSECPVQSENSVTRINHYATVWGLREGQPKNIKKKTHKKNSEIDPIYNLQILLNEARILTSISTSPYIVNLVGIYNENLNFSLVFEYYPNGSLSAWLQSGLKISYQTFTNVAYCISKALYFLTENGVCHGDLAGRNILMSNDGTPKLCDFGIAFDPYHKDDRKQFKIPLATTAPEFQTNQAKQGKSSPSGDIWSFGVLMIEMLTGGKYLEDTLHLFDSRFESADNFEILLAISKLIGLGQFCYQPPNGTPSEFKEIITACLSYHEEKRPKASELVEKFKEIKNKNKGSMLMVPCINSWYEPPQIISILIKLSKALDEVLYKYDFDVECIGSKITQKLISDLDDQAIEFIMNTIQKAIITIFPSKTHIPKLTEIKDDICSIQKNELIIHTMTPYFAKSLLSLLKEAGLLTNVSKEPHLMF